MLLAHFWVPQDFQNLSKGKFALEICVFVVMGARGVCNIDPKRASLKREPPDQLRWPIRNSEANITFNQIGCTALTTRMRGGCIGCCRNSPFHCFMDVNLIRNEKFVRDKKLTTFIIKCREKLPVTSFWWWALGGRWTRGGGGPVSVSRSWSEPHPSCRHPGADATFSFIRGA